MKQGFSAIAILALLGCVSAQNPFFNPLAATDFAALSFLPLLANQALTPVPPPPPFPFLPAGAPGFGAPGFGGAPTFITNYPAPPAVVRPIIQRPIIQRPIIQQPIIHQQPIIQQQPIIHQQPIIASKGVIQQQPIYSKGAVIQQQPIYSKGAIAQPFMSTGGYY